ncbi:MAG: hypothetical protein O3C49_02515 [Proteobacteria bacterium]|nr:hypothetical protein [Pseudomonadota bacterium]MDA1324303.1 hypothetical protein [Pseudomonadota bacterium]
MAATEFHNHDLDPSQDPLWHRIEAFDFNALDETLPFAQRLARENGWTPDHAARVVEEYKRFCYLAINAGHAVVPPDQIDQAWRLHLCYSQDYWDIFCAKVLSADLHHNPIRYRDTEEADRHRDAYAATMKSYESLSGERPPPDIWPIAELLFADTDSMRRVNAKNYLILRRPPRGLLWVAQIALILATLYCLLQAAFATAVLFGAGAVALAIFRDTTDNEWLAKPFRDGDDDGTGSGGGGMRGI